MGIQLAHRLRAVALCLLSILVGLSGTVPTATALGFAAPEDISNRQKAHLDISFTGGGEGAGDSCSESTSPLTGNDNREKAFRYFVGKGFTEKQAAGIIGNFMVESGVNPQRVQGDGVIESKTPVPGKGYGLAQWTDSTRQTNLQKEAKPVYDLGEQLDFVMWELNGPEKSAHEAFKVTTTIEQATTVWRERYERPGIDASAERLAAANLAYGDFATSAGNPTTTPATPTDTAACGGSGNIVAIAQAELRKGVLEDPIGCDIGNPSTPGDCGAEVNKYTDSTLEYWCADFVSWVYKTAGTPFKGGSSGGWRIPSVEGVQAYMEQNGTFHENSPSSPAPQPGDVYVINNGQHIGIVVKVEGNKLFVISGNTSTDNYSNGVGVGEAVYDNYKSNSSITGYGGLR